MWSNQPPIPRQQSLAEWLFWEHHTGTLGLQVAGTVPQTQRHHPTPTQLRYMEDWFHQYYHRNRRELNQQGIFDAHLAPQLPNDQVPRPGQQEGVNRQRFENPQPVSAFAQQSGQPDPQRRGFLHQQLDLQEPRARQGFQNPFSIENLLKPGKAAAKEKLPPPMPPQMLPQPPTPPTNFTHMPLWSPQMPTPTPPMLQQMAPIQSPQDHRQNELLVNGETIYITPEIRKAVESIISLPVFIKILEQLLNPHSPPTAPPMVPNEENIPHIDHQEGTSTSFEVWVPVPREEWPEEENPPHIKFGLEKGYLGYVRVYEKPTNRGSGNDYFNSPDEEEVPPAPVIESPKPEIGPRSGEQVIEPMEVANTAVNALSSGAPEEDPSPDRAVGAKRVGKPVEEQPVIKRPKVVVEGSPPEESANVSQVIVVDAPSEAQQEAEQAVNAAGGLEQNGDGPRAEQPITNAQDRQQLRQEGLRRLRALMEGRNEEFRRGIVALLNTAVARLTGPNPPETALEFVEEMNRRSQGASNNDN
ncbi:hypothetical protein CAEBREN_07888 [Caenorhabditis brenneri]|uniref:Uncharacterized protein n=1 Tax=Caenorhabditis brenneri TaxID=135651 RepID=G0P3B4_CAEBE|nr:hypothetical protein CAEBREN_07888 [Caenorhabditis brenneri]